MKRKILMVVLALGTVGGYAAGFSRARCWREHHRSQWKQEAADVCTDAAKKVYDRERARDDRDPRP